MSLVERARERDPAQIHESANEVAVEAADSGDRRLTPAEPLDGDVLVQPEERVVELDAIACNLPQPRTLPPAASPTEDAAA